MGQSTFQELRGTLNKNRVNYDTCYEDKNKFNSHFEVGDSQRSLSKKRSHLAEDS